MSDDHWKSSPRRKPGKREADLAERVRESDERRELDQPSRIGCQFNHAHSFPACYDDVASLRDWWDGLSYKQQWEAFVIEKSNADNLARTSEANARSARDPNSPPWEDCKVCGGDHWTLDHGPDDGAIE